MKSTLPFGAALSAAIVLSACASGGGLRDAEKLALYRDHAGAPVGSFDFSGRINGWMPLDDRALVVWTRPSQAYLLELYGPCQDLESTPAIGLTSSASRVYARFDKVLVHGASTIRMPCSIETIRPLDVKAVRASEKELREARIEEREAGAG